MIESTGSPDLETSDSKELGAIGPQDRTGKYWYDRFEEKTLY
jgi:hypothetical protein